MIYVGIQSQDKLCYLPDNQPVASGVRKSTPIWLFTSTLGPKRPQKFTAETWSSVVFLEPRACPYRTAAHGGLPLCQVGMFISLYFAHASTQNV
jgi:hypothetical protein